MNPNSPSSNKKDKQKKVLLPCQGELSAGLRGLDKKMSLDDIIEKAKVNYFYKKYKCFCSPFVKRGSPEPAKGRRFE
jgi:hypothetical protein